jgi:hypothetical protein
MTRVDLARFTAVVRAAVVVRGARVDERVSNGVLWPFRSSRAGVHYVSATGRFNRRLPAASGNDPL